MFFIVSLHGNSPSRKDCPNPTDFNDYTSMDYYKIKWGKLPCLHFILHGNLTRE